MKVVNKYAKTLSKNNNRLDYVDLFRGFGILLMIMGHIGFGAAFDKFIHAFHMPMFFFISGYFYKPKTDIPLLKIIKRKTKALLIPYISFSGFHYCVCFIAIKRIDLSALKSLVFNSPDPTIPIAGALWFLTALFLTEIIYLLIDGKISNLIAKNVIIISLVLIGMLFGNIIPVRLPFSLDIALVCLGFYHLGRILKHSSGYRKFSVLNLDLKALCVAAIIVSVLIFINGNVNVRIVKYANPILFWINSVTATVVGWNICRYICKVLNKIAIIDKLVSFIANIGKDSITYVCLNQIVILVVSKTFHIWGGASRLYNFIIFPLVVVLLYFIDYVIMNTKLKLFVGK